MFKQLYRLSLCASVAALAGCSGAPTEYRMVSTFEAKQQEDVAASLTKGRAMLAARQYGLAIDAFRAVLRQDSLNADAYNGLAIAYDSIGRTDLARQNFELALAHAPSDPKIARNFSSFASRHGNGNRLLAPTDRLASAMADPVAQQEPNGPSVRPSTAPIVLAKVELPSPVAPAPVIKETVIVAAPERIEPVGEATAPVEKAVAVPAEVVPLRISVDLAGLAGFRPVSAPVSIPLSAPQELMPASDLFVRVANIEPVDIMANASAAPEILDVKPSLLARFDESMVQQARISTSETSQDARSGQQLERVSLGEVRLVTRPIAPKPLDPRDSREIVVVALVSRQQEEASEAKLRSEFWTAVTKAVVRANLKDAWLRDNAAQPGALAMLQRRRIGPILERMAEGCSA